MVKKLNLINERIADPRSNRVFDSLEDAEIIQPKLSKSIVNYTSSGVKIYKNERKEFTQDLPARFLLPNVTRDGHKVSLNPLLSGTQSRETSRSPLKKSTTLVSMASIDSLDQESIATTSIIDEFYPVKIDILRDNIHSSTLDRIRDRAYDYDFDTLKARVQSKALPGAGWGKDERPLNKPLQSTTDAKIGPGSYEVYESMSSAKNIVIHDDITPLKEEKLRFLPLPERNRRLQRKKQEEILYPGRIEVKQTWKHYIPPIDPSSSLKKKDPIIKFDSSLSDRFEIHEEKYRKLASVGLDPEYDKQLNKKLPFTFDNSTKERFGHQNNLIESTNSNESQNVNIDVSDYYSIVNEANRSPVKYSSVFK